MRYSSAQICANASRYGPPWSSAASPTKLTRNALSWRQSARGGTTASWSQSWANTECDAFSVASARGSGAMAIEGDRDRVGVRRRRGKRPLQRSQLHFHEDQPAEEAEAAAERGGVAAAGVHQREQLEHELVEPLQ